MPKGDQSGLLPAGPPPLPPAPRTTKNPPSQRPGPPPVLNMVRDEQTPTNVGMTLQCDGRMPAQSVPLTEKDGMQVPNV